MGEKNANPYFELQGLSHLALVSSDMARTVDFYEGVLGMPLIKTMELPKIPGSPIPQGGQHFFFDVGYGAVLAFFWWPDGQGPAPGVAAPTSVGGQSAAGSMHHVAFKFPMEKIEETARRLEERGIPWYGGPHPLFTPDFVAKLEKTPPEELRARGTKPSHYVPGSVTENDFAYTMYFSDPDGIVLEFCAWLPAYEKIGRDHEARGASVAEKV